GHARAVRVGDGAVRFLMDAQKQRRRFRFDVLAHGVVDGQWREVRLDHTEIVIRLIAVVVAWQFEEPVVDDADPRPLAARAFVGDGHIGCRLRLGHAAIVAITYDIARHVRFVYRAPGCLADPDRFVRVAISHHDVAHVEVARVIDVRRAHAPVGRAAVQAIALHRVNVEARARPGVVHALQIDEIIEVALAQRNGRRERAVDHDNVWIDRLERVVRPAQQFGIGFGIDRVFTPFRINVRLVPDLIITDSAAIALGNGDGVIDEVLYINRRGEIAAGGRGLRPDGRVAQPRLNFQPVALRQIDDVIVFGPGVDGVDLA